MKELARIETVSDKKEKKKKIAKVSILIVAFLISG
jgi:hypothetical protein